MSHNYPRFLFSDPKNTKKPGPFIVHLHEPRFVVRVAKCPNYDKGRMTHNGKYILFFLDDIEYSDKLEQATAGMFKWIESQVISRQIVIPEPI